VPGARYRPGAHLRTDHERAAALDQGRCASPHPGIGARGVPGRRSVREQAKAPSTDLFVSAREAWLYDPKLSPKHA
jgi:hypothetical protein